MSTLVEQDERTEQLVKEVDVAFTRAQEKAAKDAESFRQASRWFPEGFIAKKDLNKAGIRGLFWALLRALWIKVVGRT